MNENKIDFLDIAERVKKEIEQLEKVEVKCAIIGRSGVGKSSLINAISGEEIAPVGEVETTMAIGEPYKNDRLWFYDLPGASTEKFPKETYVEDMKIKEMDCVIFATSDRFYEDDTFLINEIANLNIPVYLTRTKIDYSIERGEKRGVSKQETLSTIYQNLEESTKGLLIKGFYLTSADYPTNYDLSKMLEDIQSNLNDIKRKRFLMDIAITSKETLKEKRKLAESLVTKYSWAAAANGLNPIPGVDIAVDLGMITKMADTISKMFGLTKENLEYFKMLNNKSVKLAVAKASQYLIKYVGKEAITIILKKIAKTMATKTVTKYIPFIGQAVSAGLGYYTISTLGEEMVKNAEEVATELFDSISKIEE